MAALQIRRDFPPSELRRRAARERDRRAAMRLLAIANALEGMTRAEAARLAGWSARPCMMPCCVSTPRDPTAFTTDRVPAGPSEGQQAALKAHFRRGPRPERDGVSAWRLVDLCEPVEHRYGVRYSLWGLSCLLKRLNLSRQKTRPSHPKGDPAAQAAFKKGAPSAAAGPGRPASRPAPSALVRG